MSKRFIPLRILVALLLVASFMAPGFSPAQEEAPATPAQTEEKAKPEKEKAEEKIVGEIGKIYVCPVHPEYFSSKPGKCRKCKGDLVERDEIYYICPEHKGIVRGGPGICPVCKAELVPHQIFYICPMHPDVKYRQPGNCPDCGMELKKITKAMVEPDTLMKSQTTIKGVGTGIIQREKIRYEKW